MDRSVLRTWFFTAALLLILIVVACGGPNVKGPYSNANGLVTLELRSGGEASITMIGRDQGLHVQSGQQTGGACLRHGLARFSHQR